MNRPRRVRRGRSREASPEREVDDAPQEPSNESTAAPPPRRSTRNRRGAPTPPPEPSETSAVDETDTTDKDDSQAQHAQEEKDAVKASHEHDASDNGKLDTETVESKKPEQPLEQANEEPKRTSSSPADGSASKKDAAPPPEPASPSPEGAVTTNGQSSEKDIPTVSQENDTSNDERLPKLNDVNAAGAGSQATNGPGDDHATDDNETTGNEECSPDVDEGPAEETAKDKASDAVPSEALNEGLNADKGTIEGKANIPDSDNDKSASAGSQAETALASNGPVGGVQQPAFRPESRTVSLGSKSALDAVVEGGAGNDHEEPVCASASPPVSLDSQNEGKDQLNDVSEKSALKEALSLSDPVEKPNCEPPTGQEKSGVRESVPASDEKRGKNELQPASSSHLPGTSSKDTPNDMGMPGESLSGSQKKAPDLDTSDCAAETNGNATETTNAATVVLAGHDGDAMDIDSHETEGSNMTRSTCEPKADKSKQKSAAPRLKRSISNSAVVSNAFAIDIRPTAKSSSKIRRFSSGGSVEATPVLSDRASIQKKSAPSSAVPSLQQHKPDQVKNDLSLESRKHKVTNDGESSSREARLEPKRRRLETPRAVLLSALRGQTQRNRRRRKPSERNGAATRLASRTLGPGLADVESIKTRLYDVASRVHRGRSTERLFASYWEALSRFLSFQVQDGASYGNDSSLSAVHRVLDSFLITQQMRKLHNLLIMGLLAQCTKESTADNRLGDFVPQEWQARIRTRSIAAQPERRDANLPLLCASEASSALDLTDFNLLSDVWTAAGREPLISKSCGKVEPTNALISDREVAQLHRHSPCLPGALVVDPIVRSIVREGSGLKVSESAVWLLIVSVREYVQSLINDTISNVASVDTEQSLQATEFAPYAIRSGNMHGTDQDSKIDANKIASIKDAGTKTPTNDKKSVVVSSKDKAANLSKRAPSAGEKRRRITSLDIASGLSGTRLSTTGPLAGSVSGLAYENCFATSFNGNQLSFPSTFESVQSFLVDSMETASKKPRHEWLDPAPFPTPPTAPTPPAVRKTKKESPPKKVSAAASSRSLTAARNLAAPKARAAQPTPAVRAPVGVAVAAGVATATQAVPAAATVTAAAPPATPPVAKPAAGQPGSTERKDATPPQRPSPPQVISPRGRGRGHGVKDLAAMRARSGSTPPKQTGTSTSPQPPARAEANSAVARQNGGAGKELRHLEQVQKANSPEATTNTAASTIPSPAAANTTQTPGVSAVPVAPRQSNAMDTS